MATCKARQYSDQMVCHCCSKCWDVNDPEPPECDPGCSIPTDPKFGSNGRPVGHVTDLIRQLNTWARRRENKKLDARSLRISIAYLEEYRKLLNETRRPPP